MKENSLIFLPRGIYMARIELPEIFQDGMMLQRDKMIKVWGFVSGAERLRICLCQEKVKAEVNGDKFYCEIPKQSASRGETLTIYVDEKETPEITILNISIGDIYIAAGQSNMEYFLRYDAHWNDVKKWERNDDIHMFNCKRIAYEGQDRDFTDSGSWFLEHDYQWETFSAPGYSFARSLQPEIGVPVGIIGCNWGGTPACAWMDWSCFEEEPLNVFKEEYQQAIASIPEEEIRIKSIEAWAFEDSYEHQIDWRAMMYGMNELDQKEWMERNSGDPAVPLGPYHHYRPSGLYETMLKKLAPFSVKGVLWYQGESDAGHSDIYDITFKSMIECWRKLWQDELPFLFVQLAPFGVWLGIDGNGYPAVRARQEMVSKNVPGAHMVSIMDLGMYEDIHPKEKIEVGERLALLARGKIYGEDLLCESPEFTKADRLENKLILHFLNTGKSLVLKGREIKSLIVRQGDCMREIQEYEIDTEVTLTFESLSEEPLEILFLQEGYCEVNLFNEAGLPVKPFLTTCM
jgi:sialate O-acetylesterase